MVGLDALDVPFCFNRELLAHPNLNDPFKEALLPTTLCAKVVEVL
jgi:hypothetical protein